MDFIGNLQTTSLRKKIDNIIINTIIMTENRIGQKWSNEEEYLLLNELYENISIDIIAQKHKRTKGGINARRKKIAYRMYLDGIPMNEIIDKIKLDESKIKQIIKQHQKNDDIIEIKNMMTELNQQLRVCIERLNELKSC